MSPHTFITVEKSPGGFSREDTEWEEGVEVLRGMQGDRGMGAKGTGDKQLGFLFSLDLKMLVWGF